MLSIFYDLETSDKLTLGQILNYSFIVVDASFEIVRECSGLIRISRLQLPSPSAIRANKLDVLKHQEAAHDSEPAALKKIKEFIESVIEDAGGKVPLIGYNSSGFDLRYLRTSLIRNGLNPYFGGKVIYRDLLHLTRKLSCSREDFPRRASAECLGEEDARLSLSLQTVSQTLGLLSGAQSHESRDDVILTIELAKYLKKNFGTDIRTFESYEPRDLDKSARSGKVYLSKSPQYDLSLPEIFEETPMTLLDANHRYALWVNLDAYKEKKGRSSIYAINKTTQLFFMESREFKSETLSKLAAAALKEFESINLANYFTASVCDIEQDIFRIDFDSLDILHASLWGKEKSSVKKAKNKDISVLLTRFKMSAYEWGGDADDKVWKMLREYSLYRYGGRANVSKSNIEELYEEGIYSEHFHPTLPELFSEIESIAKEGDQRTRELMFSLRQFYRESDVYKAAGAELLKMAPRKTRPGANSEEIATRIS